MSLFEGVDRVAVILYLLLVAAGMVSILSASYDDTISGFFSLEHVYMKQAVWIAAAFGAALVILLLDARYYHMYAYYAYAAGIVLLVAVLLFGREVNGAKAWFEFGSVRVQPVEFVKIATALAVARMMSNYSFSIRRTGDLLRVAFVILLPLAIIVLQNDTGSGVVLCSFLFVLYREGLNKWICIPIILVAALFIFSFLFTPLFLLALRRHRDGRSGSGGRGICPAQEYLGHLRDAGTLRRVDDLRAYGRHDLRDDPPATPA